MAQIGGNAQRIRPVSLLGEGQFGQVCVGMDEVLHRRVVVKQLARQFHEPETRYRLIEEARILSRLDHPNILRIYDYSEEDGHDVFTIEYASGTDLTKALAEGLDFTKKVRIATAVVSALAVAHRHGIVHGALSPETVVIDGDVVKLVDFTSTSTKLTRGPSAAKWQSPEQIRGEEPVLATDMYAFGLLLRELFGEEDRDVRALVASLVREAPTERATAATTLEELQRLGRRPARRLRIAAISLIAAFFLFGSVKYTVDLRRERSEALAAKAEAEARRAEANQLVSFMIMDLRPKLADVGRLDIMDAATAKGLDYFASVDPDKISPSEYAVHIEAINQLGTVQLSRANVPAALAAYRRAIHLGETMLRRHPENLDLRHAVAHCHAKSAVALDRAGDLNGAFAHCRAFAAIAADLVRRAPQRVLFLQAAAIARSNLGSIHDRREEIAAALREFETAVAMEQRAISLGGTESMRFDLFVTMDKVGMSRFKLGRIASARKLLEDERAKAEALASQSRNKSLRELVGRFDQHIGAVAIAAGDVAGAARHAATHLASAKELVAFEPDNADWVVQLAAAQRSSGTVARMSGDERGAVDHHAAAIGTLSGILQDEKRTTALVREMGMTRVEYAQSLLAAGFPAAAAEEAQRAVAELRQIQTDLPARRTFGEALFVEGAARAARGDRDAAMGLWQQALTVIEPLDALSPDPRITDLHARVLLRLGRAEWARARIEELAVIGYRHPEYLALVAESTPQTN